MVKKLNIKESDYTNRLQSRIGDMKFTLRDGLDDRINQIEKYIKTIKNLKSDMYDKIEELKNTNNSTDNYLKDEADILESFYKQLIEASSLIDDAEFKLEKFIGMVDDE